MKKIMGIVIILLMHLFVPAQDLSAYHKGIFSGHQLELPYRFLSPVTETGKKYPLVIFLHGAYEKGNDNERQLTIGGRFFLRDSIRKNYPSYILFPQCPTENLWAYFENKTDFTTGLASDWNFPFKKEPTSTTGQVKKLIDSLLVTCQIDANRIYIAGFSQGGMGVLDMIARYPDIFAAGLAICGAGEPTTTRLFAGKVSLWLFHGDQDEIIPVTFSQQYYKRLKRAGAVVRYSEYQGVGHNSWAKAFAEPELMQWLFAQVKR